ncbi:MAG: hypothetical protein NTX13_08445 [Acidobacteria bacterium]|nr:hypothetical protein [Acidobacteriota bacterium]
MNSFLKGHLNDEHCFLCGCGLHDGNRSDEHVIPRWLQGKYNLWNQKLSLLNDTDIPYRRLLIPCCKQCNNERLAPLENEVVSLLLQPFRSPTGAEEHRLFQWCSKILYGLLHRQMMLQADRTSRSEGTIVKREFLDNLTTFHHFMTSIVRPMRFEGFVPYSLFAAETLTYEATAKNFDYFDFLLMGQPDDLTVALCLAIRVEHFGVICVFQDNGFQREYFKDQFERFGGMPLHPIQFLELACKSACKHSLLSFSPKYHSIASPDVADEIVILPANSPRGTIWKDWSEARYASVFCYLAERSGFSVPPPEEMYVNGQHYTWLSDPNGRPLRLTEQDEQRLRRDATT